MYIREFVREGVVGGPEASPGLCQVPWGGRRVKGSHHLALLDGERLDHESFEGHGAGRGQETAYAL